MTKPNVPIAFLDGLLKSLVGRVPQGMSKISLRSKLAVAFLAVVLVCATVATLVGVRLIVKGIVGQAQEKVTNDLNAAAEIYREQTDKIRDAVRFTAVRFFLRDALKVADVETLKKELEAIRQGESLDILTVTDNQGRVIVRARNPSLSGDSQARDELVSRVLSQGTVVSGTVIVSREELAKEGADLAERAHVEFLPTPRARPRPESEQTSGMMIKAAAPVVGHNGSLTGVLYGGVLLNRNYTIVDRVKEAVYRSAQYKGKDIGTATIFQGDVRISTNVRDENGQRAICTRLSQEVYEQVLVKELPWIGRAFVVNDWYITAYQPIRDVGSRIIGALYVGMLEEEFTDLRQRAVAMYMGIMLIGIMMALIVSGVLARGILKPIERLVVASHRWAKGDLAYRVETGQKDEISQLGETFNQMASALEERDRKLKEYTSQQIMKSERLATLGQLAAGVAHEINNPLGAVLMYVHLALEESGLQDPTRDNLNKAVREAARCRDIVSGLLDFARQTEPEIRVADVNETVERTLAVLEHQALLQNIRVHKRLCPSLPKVPIDANQIQQVFTNIVLNAVEAMDANGDLTIITRTGDDRQCVEVEFTDTGRGIPPEQHEKIFEPFFTTKEVGRGTGLGLAISHGIVMRHHGTIELKSEPAKGTTFTIRLPLR